MRPWIVPAVAAWALAACSGGGGGKTTPLNPSATAAAQMQTGTLALTIPAASSGSAAKRSPQFVSPAALSASIQIDGGTGTVVNLSGTSSSCQTSPAGLRSCSITISAPVGNTQFAVSLFAGLNASGAELGFGENTSTVVLGTPFSVSVGIDPAVAGVAAFQISGGGTFTLGTAGSATLTITFADPALQPILGSGNVPAFLTAVTFTSSDPHITFQPSTLTTPGQTLSVNYDGSPAVAETVTVTAAAGGTTLGTVPVSIPGLYATRISLGAANTINPNQITVGSDGNLWLTETTTGRVDRVTTAGALNQYTVAGISGFPDGIATGGDGNLYVSNDECNIYKITPTNPPSLLGTATVPNGSGGSCAVAKLAADSSGNVWFLDVSTSSRVGYVTTALAVNVYNTVSANAFNFYGLSGLALGADKAIWFAEPNTPNVGRVGTPASGGTGTVTEYAIPNATADDTEPVGITSGPDNNLWLTVPNFSVTSDQFFAYFAPATPTSIHEYPNVINSVDFANWVILTSGSDGNLWTTQGAGAVKIPPGNPTGAVIEIFTDDVGTDNHSSVTGPDGNIWFTGLGNGSINDQVVHYLPR